MAICMPAPWDRDKLGLRLFQDFVALSDKCGPIVTLRGSYLKTRHAAL